MKKFRNIIVCLMAVSLVLSAAGCNSSKSRDSRKKRTKETEEAQTIETDESAETTINIHIEETTATSEETTTTPPEESSEGLFVDEDGYADLGFTQGLIEIADENYAFTGTSPDMIDVTGGYKSIADYQGEGDSEARDRLFGEYYYNSNGDLVLFCRYGEEGDLVHSEYYEYDDQNNLLVMQMWSRDSYQDSSFKAYDYNDDGSIAAFHYGKASGYISSTTVFEYDDQGRLISETGTVTDNDEPSYKYEYTYNDDGSYTKIYLGRNLDGELANSSEGYDLYNADGLHTEYYTGPLSNDYTYYTYDENGRLIGDEDYSGSLFKGNTVYTYDEEGRMIQKDRYYSSGSLNYSIVFTIEEM